MSKWCNNVSVTLNNNIIHIIVLYIVSESLRFSDYDVYYNIGNTSEYSTNMNMANYSEMKKIIFI